MKEGQPAAIHLADYEPPVWLIEFTELTVDLHDDYAEVTANLGMQRNPASADREPVVRLQGQQLETQQVLLDGRKLEANEFVEEDDSLTVHDVPEAFVLTTTVRIRPQDNTSLQGLYCSGDMFCTQCEAEGFRGITWYLDRPDVLSRFSTTIRADRERLPVLLSNGNEVARGEDGDRHWVTWKDPFPKPAYLFALVAGDLQHIEDRYVTGSGRTVTLRIFTEPQHIDKVDYAMSALKRSMEWDERTYGREYDLDIFMVVAVDSFNFGAMENKGLNIFNTSCVLATPQTATDARYQWVEGVVAHEYFHNWSGNRVTCRDWFQLSLKEGFTVFRDQQFSADMNSPTVCRVANVGRLRNTQFPEDAGPMAHPVRPSSYIEIDNFYTATVYEKGAEVVRMIRTLLGPQRFRRGSDLYFERHDGQAVTTDDFVAAMADANDFDFTQFKRWYEQAGTPHIEVTGEHDAAARTFTLRVRQSCPPTPGQKEKQPLHIPFAVGLLGADGRDLPLHLPPEQVSSLDDSDGVITAVLHVTEADQTFVFRDIDERPVPSLLRGFSAPVRLDFDYSAAELAFLIEHDGDGFNRWEAMQRFGADAILAVCERLCRDEAGEVDPRFVAVMQALLQQVIDGHGQAGLDRAMIAEMLLLPSEAWLAELIDGVVPVDKLHAAWQAVRRAVATHCREALERVCDLNKSDRPYSTDPAEIARRSLRNISLGYLLADADDGWVARCVAQFRDADNMTDQSAALRCLVNCPGAEDEAKAALADFYERWQHEALVIDLWFGIQGACSLPGTLEQVQALLEHPALDIKVPNRVRALMGAFMQNTPHFHAASGSGYRLLADIVLRLDPINPLVAARLVEPLTRWRRYDKQRQELMLGELERILQAPDLSPNVYEIVSKSLPGEGEGKGE